MRIGLLQEGDLTGTTAARRYHEMIEEVALADRLGFSVWGTSEQHFSPPSFSVAAPEVLYAAVAMRTENIKLRTMASVMLAWNHPILVAERLATLDIVSNGRAEICTARSNNLTTLAAFGVDPGQTRQQWEESMEVLVKALRDERLEHHGKLWDIPEREIVPRPVTRPHPPISVAASSIRTHANAGERGFGAICFENYFGFDYLQECIGAYRNALQASSVVHEAPNDYFGLYVASAYCAPTSAEAKQISRDIALGYFHFILDLYAPLASNPGYEYLERIKELIAREGDLDWLRTETPSVMIGSPADFIDRLRDLAERGVDEVLLRIDGMGHENIMRSIELIGREVIPAVSAAGVAGAPAASAAPAPVPSAS
jgi:alkanesulfonate monooxygenase SsuD/methylene tetrahydromethanopterin reductase-like flavin-dependent oxidoreductase (luciferase family)